MSQNINTKEQFLMVPYSILQDENLNLFQKFILAYVQGWERAGKICEETQSQQAKNLGLPRMTYIDNLNILIKKGYITKDLLRKMGSTKNQYKNRKALKSNEIVKPVEVPVKETKPQPEPINEELDIDSLISFNEELAKTYTGHGGKKFMVGVKIKDNKIKTLKEIEQEYAN